MESNDIKVVKIDDLIDYNPSFSRRDLYRICIVSGESTLYFEDKKIKMSGTYLFFGNINTPYSWETGLDKNYGYSCLFTSDYLKAAEIPVLDSRTMSLFNVSTVPLYEISDQAQIEYIRFIFERITLELRQYSDNRKSIIRNLLELIFFETHKLVTKKDLSENNKNNASHKLCSEFISLLDNQFPVESQNGSLKYKTVYQYAEQLSVHPNYLNRAIKEQLGKTALKVINERILKESKILLLHTNWTIAEIAYALGFEYPSYFDNAFKKNMGISPGIYRKQQKSII